MTFYPDVVLIGQSKLLLKVVRCLYDAWFKMCILTSIKNLSRAIAA